MESVPTTQLNNIQPPVASALPGVGVTAIAVTTTPNYIDLYKAPDQPRGYPIFDRYIWIMADGCDVYWLSGMSTSPTINPSASGTTFAGGTTAAVPGHLVNGVKERVRLDAYTSRYLQFQAASGTGIVRIWAASQPGLDLASY